MATAQAQQRRRASQCLDKEDFGQLVELSEERLPLDSLMRELNLSSNLGDCVAQQELEWPVVFAPLVSLSGYQYPPLLSSGWPGNTTQDFR